MTEDDPIARAEAARFAAAAGASPPTPEQLAARQREAAEAVRLVADTAARQRQSAEDRIRDAEQRARQRAAQPQRGHHPSRYDFARTVCRILLVVIWIGAVLFAAAVAVQVIGTAITRPWEGPAPVAYAVVLAALCAVAIAASTALTHVFITLALAIYDIADQTRHLITERK